MSTTGNNYYEINSITFWSLSINVSRNKKNRYNWEFKLKIVYCTLYKLLIY